MVNGIQVVVAIFLMGAIVFRLVNFSRGHANSITAGLGLSGIFLLCVGLATGPTPQFDLPFQVIESASAKPLTPPRTESRALQDEAGFFKESESDFTVQPALTKAVKSAEKLITVHTIKTIAPVKTAKPARKQATAVRVSKTMVVKKPAPAPIGCYTNEDITHYQPLDSIPVNWKSRNLRKYDHLFEHYTRKYFGNTADWRWFKVQSFVESNLNNHAISSSGAVGLMQIMPSTFKQIQKMNRFFRGKSLNNPEWNIAAGIYYNKYLLDEWTVRAAPYKRLQLMFASYNAGLGRVSRTFPDYHLEEDDLLIHSGELPQETSRYLRKISHFMKEYRGVAFVAPEHNCYVDSGFSPLMIASNSW